MYVAAIMVVIAAAPSDCGCAPQMMGTNYQCAFFTAIKRAGQVDAAQQSEATE